MANKTFYYMEISIPGATDVIGEQRALLDMHIAATNSKNSKIAKEFIFSDVKLHDTVDGTQAVTIEFMNSRTYETYRTVIQEFRDWVVANHNVTYVYEKISETTFGAAAVVVDKEFEEIEEATYYDKMHKYMMVTLPTERGFIS